MMLTTGYARRDMAITFEPTPNPNAMKFSVGEPVGGPGTYVKGAEPEEEFLAALLAIDEVASVFFTADFVTISKTPDGSWDAITPEATAILESHFGD
jgi:NFU1 iron-sulfur cluster scaffold homolog, mitochondrial